MKFIGHIGLCTYQLISTDIGQYINVSSEHHLKLDYFCYLGFFLTDRVWAHFPAQT